MDSDIFPPNSYAHERYIHDLIDKFNSNNAEYCMKVFDFLNKIYQDGRRSLSLKYRRLYMTMRDENEEDNFLSVLLDIGPTIYLYHLKNILDLVIMILKIKNADYSLSKLKFNILELYSEIDEYVKKNMINFDYYIFLDMNNPDVNNLITNKLPLTPGTFELYKTLNDEEVDTIISDPNLNNRYRHLDNNNADVLQWKSHFAGWNKKRLYQVLTDMGILDYDTEKYGRKYAYDFPILNELGLAMDPGFYRNVDVILKRLPRYVLEALYIRLVDTSPNWEEIIKSRAPTESIRKLAYKEFGVVIEGNRDDVYTRIKSIIRNKELSEVLPKLKEEFIFSPGNRDYPHVQRLKYTSNISGLGNIPSSRINIDQYFNEINLICNDSSKTNIDAYQLALDLGIERYITEYDRKERICQVINNYLNVIKDERII